MSTKFLLILCMLSLPFIATAQDASVKKDNSTVNKSKEPFYLHPNPARDIVYVSSKNNDLPLSISVYNLIGRLMAYTKNDNQINVSSLPAGVYQVRIETTNGIVNNQLMKQ